MINKKILRLGWDLETMRDNCRYYFWKEFEKYHTLHNVSFHLDDVLSFNEEEQRRKVNQKLTNLLLDKIRENIKEINPNMIIINERLCRTINSGLNLQTDIPVLFMIHDWHFFIYNKLYGNYYSSENIQQFICNHNVVGITSQNKFIIPKLEQYFGKTIYHLPHSVNTEIFKDYNDEQIYDVLSSGIGFNSHWDLYPFRRYIHLNMPKEINYYNMKDKENFTRDAYAQKISKSKIFIFGTGKNPCAIQKMWEGSASNSLVMTNGMSDDKANNFIDGETFIKINKENYIEKIKYYLNHDEEREEIIKNANIMTKKYHTTEIRVKEFLEILK